MRYYHYTPTKNIPSILERGLIPAFTKGGYGNTPDGRGVWLDVGRFELVTPGWSRVEIDSAKLNGRPMTVPLYNNRGRWVIYNGTIPPDAIVDVKSYTEKDCR